MQSKNWKNVKPILEEVLELDSGERLRFLNNPDIEQEIKTEVETLLAFEDTAENWSPPTALDLSKEFFDDEDSAKNYLIGQKIGIYQVSKEIGFGGMGAVYLAERVDDKFKQKVAIKLLRREFNTEKIRKRFRVEREIQAALVHPNIATLLDAGTTDEGIPYLVMEYVEGVRVDKFCDENNLNLNERLKLFNKVCEAVAFAHRNLIIHRDIKPSNIIVTKKGEPKLLDFGISKLIDRSNLNTNTVTKLGAMTPEYASPEQIKGESVTTATDIYSLGVILFKILTGTMPYDTKDKSEAQIFSEITGSQPKTPSETTSGNPKSLRGDLDNIILKSLRKEPERRYKTVEQFAADIWRFIDGLPVLARRSTFSYRASKFYGRNKAGVFAVFFIFLTLIGGIAATLWQARIAQAESERTIAEAKKAEKINAYMQKILNFNNPVWISSNPEQNSKATVAEALEQTLENIDKDLANEPEIQAEILHTIGQSYSGQGKYEKAEKLLRRSIEKFDEVKGTGNLKSMQTSVILGDVLLVTGKLDEAEKLFQAAINYFRPIVAKDLSQTKWLVIALTDLSGVYNLTGRFDEAEQLNLESLKYLEKAERNDQFAIPVLIPVIMSKLADTKQKKGEYQAAVKYNEQALEESRKLGNEQKFEAGQIYTLLGMTLNRMKEYEQAEQNLRKGNEIFLKTVGAKNIFTTSNMFHIANSLYKQKKYDEAEDMIGKTLEVQHKLFPKGHFLIAFSQRFLGDIYTETNRLKMGETQIREALNFLSKSAKYPNPDVAKIQTSLAKNLIAQKRLGEAKELLAEALDASSKTKGEDHPDTKEIRELLSKIP